MAPNIKKRDGKTAISVAVTIEILIENRKLTVIIQYNNKNFQSLIQRSQLLGSSQYYDHIRLNELKVNSDLGSQCYKKQKFKIKLSN